MEDVFGVAEILKVAVGVEERADVIDVGGPESGLLRTVAPFSSGGSAGGVG